MFGRLSHLFQCVLCILPNAFPKVFEQKSGLMYKMYLHVQIIVRNAHVQRIFMYAFTISLCDSINPRETKAGSDSKNKFCEGILRY